MANQTTLNDVIERMKAEGHLNRNSGTNSLKSLKEELKLQTQLQVNMMEKFEIFFDKMEADRLQSKMGGLRPVQPIAPAEDIESRTGVKKSESEENVVALGAFAGLLTSLAAAIAALEGLTTLKSIKDIGGSIVKGVGEGLKSLGKGLDKLFFGLPTKIAESLRTAFDNLKLQFKLGSMEFKDTKLGNIINSVWNSFKTKLASFGESFKNLFKPIGDFFKSGMGDVKSSGILKSVGEGLGKVGGWLKGIFAFFGRVLYPLAVLFSAIDGTKEAMNQYDAAKDESLISKITKTLGGFTGGFLGSFFGGFFDLIKNGFNWVLKKVFPGFVDDKGNWKKDSTFGSIMGNIEEFSFAKFITDSINSVFGFIAEVFDWITDKFGKIADFLGFDMNKIKGDPSQSGYVSSETERGAANRARSKSGMSAPEYNRFLKNASDDDLKKLANESNSYMDGYDDEDYLRGLKAEQAKLLGYKPRVSATKPPATKSETRMNQLSEETAKQMVKSNNIVVAPSIQSDSSDNSTKTYNSYGGGDTGLSAQQQAQKTVDLATNAGF